MTVYHVNSRPQKRLIDSLKTKRSLRDLQKEYKKHLKKKNDRQNQS